MSASPAAPDSGRPIDELLAAYAAGTLCAPLQRLVAAHLALKPENRDFVAVLEDVAGRMLDELPLAAVADRDRKLAAIFAHGDDLALPPAWAGADLVPAPLAHYVARPMDSIPWKTRLPGIREYRVEQSGGAQAMFYWIKPGRVMPSHTHDGTEVTLILKGGFTDPSGHYRRGDIAIADHEVDHHPRADEDEDCLCFAVTDAPLRLTGTVGRIVQHLFGQ